MGRRREHAGRPRASRGIIAPKLLANAVVSVEAMDTEARMRLGDEVYTHQPNLLASVLALPRMGVSLHELEVLVTILLVTWQVMKAIGRWPTISEETQELCLQRITATWQFMQGLPPTLQQRALQDQLNAHPEPQLLAFVYGYLSDHKLLGLDTEAEKHLLLAALNLVDCVAATAPKQTR